MKHILSGTLKLAAVSAVVVSVLSSAALAELYKVTSIAPGMSPFVVNTAIAKVVNTHVDGVEFQVRATGAATKHMVDAASGSVDFRSARPRSTGCWSTISGRSRTSPTGLNWSRRSA